MQAIAHEINFSETTFIFPPERSDTDVRMRIFTPAVEMPMAGHPTVGSTFALAHVGVIEPARQRFVFGLNVGPTPVDLVWENGRLQFAWMTQAPPRSARPSPIAMPSHVRSDLAKATCWPADSRGHVRRALSARRCAIRRPSTRRRHPRISNCLVCRARIRRFWSSRTGYPAKAGLQLQPDVRAGARGRRGPGDGERRRPARCYLVQHRLVPGDTPQRIVNTQGVKMGRASRIHMAITGAPDAITDVRVGGEAVLVARGEFLAAISRAPTA